MANFTERIKIIVDVVADSAKTGLGNFKTAVSEAETTTGKFKAGATSAFDTIKANAGSLAIGAGGALVAFGIKAVGVFDDTAKHAEDMAAATGLSIEQASRWIAIADDLGVSAESIQGSFGKIIKGLDKKVWEDYGVATHDAGGKLRDTNDIMLDAFDTLSKIPAGSARAKAGTDLFGKSYKDLAPLIGKSRSEMEKYLGAVESGQVITDDEAASAKRMRLAQDDLRDAVGQVTQALGGMIAQAAPAVEGFAKIITKALELKDVFNDIPGAKTGGDQPFSGFFGNLFDNLGGAKDAFTDLIDRGKEVIKYGPFSTTEQQNQEKWADHIAHLVVPSIDDLDRAHKNLATGGMSDVEFQTKQNEIAAAKYAEQVDTTNRQVQSDIQEIENKWKELHGELDRETAWIQLQQQAVDVKNAFDEAGRVAKEKGPGSPEAIKASQDAQLELLGLKSKVADYGKEILGLPPEKVTTMLTEIDPNNITATLEEMDVALLNHKFRINAHLDTIIVDGETHAAGQTKITIGTQNPNVRAAGGPVVAGEAYTVGEKGTETFVPNESGTIVPHGGSFGNTTIINHWPPGVSVQEYAKASRDYQRRGGR